LTQSIELPVLQNHALILGNSPIAANFDPTTLGKPRLIVAADGGARLAQLMGLKIDALIGDLDSIPPELLAQYQAEKVTIRHLASQNINDLEKTIRYLRQQRVDDFTLLGFTGARSDQNMATLCVCRKFQTRARFRIIANDCDIYLLPPDNYHWICPPGQTISLFGFPQARGITTSGLQYELKKAILKSSSRGVSNVVTNSSVTISWRAGYLLIFQMRRS
jgi:thiamine pyrophosphokinase